MGHVRGGPAADQHPAGATLKAHDSSTVGTQELGHLLPDQGEDLVRFVGCDRRCHPAQGRLLGGERLVLGRSRHRFGVQAGVGHREGREVGQPTCGVMLDRRETTRSRVAQEQRSQQGRRVFDTHGAVLQPDAEERPRTQTPSEGRGDDRIARDVLDGE